MGEVSGGGRRTGVIGLLSCFAFLLLTPLGTGTAASAVADNPFPLERLFDFGPEGAEETDFEGEGVDSIALDQEDGHVYVLDRNGSAGTLHKFGPDGEPVDFTGTASYIDGNQITGLEPFAAPGAYGSSTQVAVDPLSKVIYVTETDAIRAFEASGEPAEFTAGPGENTSEIPGFTELVSVDVDASGNIYASDRSGEVSIFASTGAPLTSFSVASPENIGVDSNGAVYVLQGQLTVKRFTPSPPLPITESTTYSEAPFVESDGFNFIVGFDIDTSNDEVYVLESEFNNTWILRYDGTSAPPVLIESFGAPGSDTEDEALLGASEAIAVWEQAKEIVEGEAVKLYADEAGTSRVAALGREDDVGPPEISSTSVLDVTADSAKLRAWIDPNTGLTTYHFEYGPEDCEVSACTSVPLGGASAGDGEDPVEVSHSIFGLQPGTTYYYRVVAESPLSLLPVEGPVRTFRTQPLGSGFQLVDSRVWEMVSPPDKNGALLKGTRGGVIQAASDGDGLAYLSLGSIEPDPQGNRSPEFSSIVAQRGPGGWHSQDITSANQEAVQQGVGQEGEFKLFSSDLSQGMLTPPSDTPLSPQATERTPYLRLHGEPPAYTPLLTAANVPPGTEFGGPSDVPVGPVRPVGATSSLSHVVLHSNLNVPLVAGLPTPTPGALYLWTEGQLRPVSMLPADEGDTLAAGPTFGSGAISIQHAISADGSRVFWGLDDALYVRDTIAEQTVRLDVPEEVTGAGAASPVFQGANADGTVVYFTDSRDLTADASPSGRDLYRCAIPAGSPAAGCANLANLSVPFGLGESGDVLGMVSGLSEDGRRVYFVAKGLLDKRENPQNQYGEEAVPGASNLYSWEEGDGARFIASLDDEDARTWGIKGGNIVGGDRSATASPSGRYLAFMSQRSLTGSDNLEATSGQPVQEVFRYDALTEELDCLSCNPFGAAPEGEVPVGQPLISPSEVYGGLQVAAALPVGSKFTLGEHPSLYRSRTALDNGRVFFNAFGSLVPADSNGEWDVYQWEPVGVGSCGASSGDRGTIRSAGGCVSLLSSGTAEEAAGFFDASVSGDDVFFLTPARLAVTDVDNEFDVYDARVGGVQATLLPRPECQGDACRSVVVPPGALAPGSATFQGSGNVKPDRGERRCPKGKRKVRSKGKVRCVRKNRRGKKNRQGKRNRQSQERAGQNRGTVR